MSRPLELLVDPWRLFEIVLDGPLHPGGTDATEDLLDRAGVDSGTRLLDVGCGAGDAVALARSRGASAVGLDRRPTGTDVVRGDLEAFPFQIDSFDVVLSECVLCLSSDFDRTLADIETILRPGGRLVLSDVTVEETLPELPAPIDDLLCLDGPREQNHILQQIEYAGFTIDDVQTHHDDLLALRDRLRMSLDSERLMDALGDRAERLRDGATEVEAAVESGRIGYVSVVATPQSR